MSRAPVFLFLFFVGFPAFSNFNLQADDRSQAQLYFEEAQKLKQAQNFDGAEESMKKAVNLEPSNPELHFELANLYAVRHDRLKGYANSSAADQSLEACIQELQQAVTLKPDFLPATYNLGVVYKKRGEYEKAREEFRRVLELDPNQVNAYLQIAGAYEDQGFFDEARDIYRTAKERNLKNPDIDAALEDLQHKEQESEKTESFRIPTNFLSRGGPFGYGNNIRPNDMDPSQNYAPTQALPYVGMLLMQEFMKKKSQQ